MDAVSVATMWHPTFGTMERFFEHFETSLREGSTSSRMLVLCRYIIQLVYLAEGDVSDMDLSGYCYSDCFCFSSLRGYKAPDLIARARRRIEAGEVPEDWHARLISVAC